jgi:ABC-type nitrate/sulfonate/bicarbonate transport system substrate-binding protein
VTVLTLGFIPLTDCAPLVVARDKGFFVAEGLDVILSREASWATIRDKVTYGALDGAHMLGALALAATLQATRGREAMIAPLALNRNGAGLTVSRGLAEEIAATGSVGETLRRRDAPATFAVVYPYSIHNYLLRGWLAEAGLEPDRDVRIVVTPPQRMVEQLADGRIDGFCAGAPWNAVAVQAGAGEMLASSKGLLPGAPDKVLGLAEAWAVTHPETVAALLRALVQAGAWADEPGNRAELIALLAAPGAVGAAPEAIAPALEREIVFQRDEAGVPTTEDALWILSRMQRWGQAPADTDPAIAERVYRADLLRKALG